MGLKEVPEHEAPLPAGKGRRTKTGNKRECSLNLILEQTILGKTLAPPPPLYPTIHFLVRDIVF